MDALIKQAGSKCFLGETIVSVNLKTIEQDLNALCPSTGYAKKVFCIFKENCWSTIDVSSAINTSTRTLQRRLEAEGTGFVYLRDLARFKLTVKLLKNGGAIPDVAKALGFSDRTSFTNALSRWYQVTPAVLRAQLKWNEGEVN